MKTLLATFPLLLGAAMLLAQPAAAQSNCGPRDAVVERLSQAYDETRQSIGLAANNMVVETWASLDSGTWTVTVTRPDGVTCLVASGDNFQLVEDLPPEGDPTF